jgi:CMP-N-acetylneuraminic acid synthetase
MTEEVVRHVLLEWCEPDIDSVVVVQPTSPFTSADDVTSTLRALRVNSGAATALTALRLPPTTAYALVEDETGLARFLQPHLLRIRTQDLPPLHAPTGGVYAAPAARLRSGGALVAEPVAIVEVPIERALDVDGPADLNRARRQATLKRDGIS